MNALELVKAFYGNRKALRSGVPKINHIEEGVRILQHLGAHQDVQDAFCLHPMFQHHDDLTVNWYMLAAFSPMVVAYVMEYRNIANAALSDNVSTPGYMPAWTGKKLTLSPLPQVNMMLIADKVQNRADFDIYHKGKHVRSKELDFYFQTWHNALGVTEERYKELTKVAKEEA